MPDIQSSSLPIALLLELGRDIHLKLPSEINADIATSAEEVSAWNGFSSTGNSEILTNHVRQAFFSSGGQNPVLAEAKLKTQLVMSEMAGNKTAFHDFYKKIYGDRYDATVVENMRQQFLAGDFSSLPEFRMVSSETLHGNHAAYGDGVVYLSEELLQNPDQLVAYMLEETAHHFDTFFGAGDARGDEGELFRRMISGEQLSDAEISNIRSEDDRGSITVDGKQIEVEFGWKKKLKKALKKVRNAIKKVVDKCVDLVKDLIKAVVDSVKFSMQMMAFPIDYAINGEEAVDRLEAAAKQALISFLQSELAQWIVTAIVTFFTAGTMTGPMIAFMEGMKQGLMVALKEVLIEYVKQQIINMIVQKVAEATGSETLACIVGAFLNNPGGLDGMTEAMQQKLASFTSEQVVDMAKDQVKQQLTKLVVKEISEHVDFKPLQIFLTSWVQNGANLDDLNTTLTSLQKKVTETVSNMSWENTLTIAKDLAKDYAVEKIEREIGYAPAKDAFSTWTQNGATLDRLPALLDNMQESVKKDLSLRIIEKVSREVGPAPIRDALTGWINDGADFKTLPSLLGHLKNEFKEEMSAITIGDILNKVKQEGQEALLGQIQDNVGYKPLQKSLTEWVEKGAHPNEFYKVFDTIKSDAEQKFDQIRDKTSDAHEKAANIWEKVFVENTTPKDTAPLRELLNSINQTERRVSTSSPDLSDILTSAKVATEEKLIERIGNEFNTSLPAGSMKDALIQWVAKGMQAQALTDIPGEFAKFALASESHTVDPNTINKMMNVMGPEILAELTGAMNFNALAGAMADWPALETRLNGMLAKAESISDKVPGSDDLQSQAHRLRTTILPEFSNALGESASYLKSFQQVLEQTEKKISRMQAFQACGGAA